MMTAPLPDPPPSSELPDWLFPPSEGFTAEDLDRIPQLPDHTELIDGCLVFASPQTNFHMLTISLLEMVLRRLAPARLRVRREMTVIAGKRQRPEPDVMVAEANADTGPAQTAYHPGDVVLVIEVVSPDSEERDRKRKPQLYAEAGIGHMRRVENNAGRPAVYVYELDPAVGAYALTGIHHERLKLSVPPPVFGREGPPDMDIDLTEADRL